MTAMEDQVWYYDSYKRSCVILHQLQKIKCDTMRATKIQVWYLKSAIVHDKPPPPHLPPLLLLPLLPLLPLCQNVGSNSKDDDDNNKEKAMMGGLCVLVVKVVCAGCVCAACPCCFGRLTHIAPTSLQTTAYWGLPERSFPDKQTHCI